MNRVKQRTLSIVIISAMMVIALLIFLMKYEANGKNWVSFASNSHVYTQGILTAGKVLDRDGTVLLQTVDGVRTYNEDKTIRKATLHAVGDAAGNIGTGAQKLFATKLMGYNLLNGVYSLSGNGRDLYLTIDADLNSVAYKALDGRRGCVGVYDYLSGDIICMVSSPGFDPSAPPDTSAADDSSGIYINRFLSSTFVPGSIFKLVTMAAAIDTMDDLYDRTFTCTGSYVVGDDTITCPKQHGEMTIEGALASSCNCTFGILGQELGSAKLSAYAAKTGLTGTLKVDGYQVAKGSFSANDDNQGELAWSAIGQGNDLVNPCTMMAYMGAIANDGVSVQPKLIKKVTNMLGLPTEFDIVKNKNTLINSDTANKLAAMMRNNVVNNYGQGNFGDLAIAAKSGTAEVGDGVAPHAWFVGFLDDPDHPLAFVVLVENGGAGSTTAGKIASTVLQEAVANFN